jgi:hypothetical protein
VEIHKAEMIFEKIKSLPDPMAEEVLNFVCFLKERSETYDFSNLIKAQSKSTKEIWDNKDDEVWNEC